MNVTKLTLERHDPLELKKDFKALETIQKVIKRSKKRHPHGLVIKPKEKIIYSEDMIYFILDKFGNWLSASEIADFAKLEFGSNAYHPTSFKRKLYKMEKDRLSYLFTRQERKGSRNRLTKLFSIKRG